MNFYKNNALLWKRLKCNYLNKRKNCATGLKKAVFNNVDLPVARKEARGDPTSFYPNLYGN